MNITANKNRMTFISLSLFTVSYFFSSVCIFGGYSGFEYAVSGISYSFLLMCPIAFLFRDDKKRGVISNIVSAGVMYIPAFFLMLICPLVIGIFCKVYYVAAYNAICGCFFFMLAVISLFALISSCINNIHVRTTVLFFISLYIYFQDSVRTMSEFDDVFYFAVMSFASLAVSVIIMIKSGGVKFSVLFASCTLPILMLSLFFSVPTSTLYGSLYAFMNGVFDVRSILFFISVSACCILLGTAISLLRISFTPVVGRKTLFFFTLPMLIYFSVNITANYIPDKYMCIDASGYSLFDLSPSSERFLSQINTPITIYELSSGEKNLIIEQLTSKISDCSNLIKHETVDTNERPLFYQKYSDKKPSDHSLIIESGERFSVIDFSDILSGDEEKVYNGESMVIEAINYVSVSEIKKIHIMYGSSEIEEFAVNNIRAAGYETTKDEEGYVPNISEILLIYNPENDISRETADSLIDFIGSGGKIIMFTKCYNGVEPLPNLMEVCKSLGMHRDAGAVFDGSLYIGYPYYTLPCLFKHQITE